MSKGKILVTPRSLSKEIHPCLLPLMDAGYELLVPWPGRQPGEEELVKEIPECIGYLAGVERITRRVLESAKSLLCISRNGVGVDSIDLRAAEEFGITVLGTPGANAQGVAELALTLMLCAMRSVPWSSSSVKQGVWQRRIGMESSGKILGIIGCGQIGKRLALMAAAIGMKVCGYDLWKDPELVSMQGFTYTELMTLLSCSDVVSLHCPPSGSPIIDSKAFDVMKDGVILVNTARSELVDEQAILQALKSGKAAHYGVDVFPKEPPEMTELLLHDRVTVTPHIGGFTNESVEHSATAAVKNLLKVLEG